MPYSPIRYILKSSTLLFCLAFFFPLSFYNSAGSGLDPSWQIAIGWAYERGLIFGREFLFTYGPFGFISTRLPFTWSHAYLVTHDLLLVLNAAFILIYCLRRLKSPYSILFLIGAVMVSGHSLFSHDLVILWTIIMLFYIFAFFESGTLAYLLISALISLGTLYMKVNLGLLGIFFNFIVYGHLIFFQKRTLLGVKLIISYLLLIFISTLMLPVDLTGYLTGAVKLASGYNEAMYLYEERFGTYIYYVIFILTSFLLVQTYHLRTLLSSTTELLKVGSTSLLWFLIYKQSFVRADGHVEVFFHFTPLLLGLLWIFTPQQRRLTNGISCWCALGISIFLFSDVFNQNYIKFRLDLPTAYLHAAVDRVPKDTSLQVRPPGAELPANFIEHIAQNSIDIIPWNVAYAYYNKLNYSPRPVMQSYAVFNSYLDRINAGKFEDSDAPQRVLFSTYSADYRYGFFDESRTKLALLKYYSPILSNPQELLLERKINRKLITEDGPLLDAKLGSKLSIPLDNNALLFAEFKINYSLLGKLLSILYRPPSLNINLHFKDGSWKSFRAVRPILEGGVIINKYVNSIKHAERFFNGNLKKLRDIRSISFSSDKDWGFNSQYQIKLSRITISD